MSGKEQYTSRRVASAATGLSLSAPLSPPPQGPPGSQAAEQLQEEKAGIVLSLFPYCCSTAQLSRLLITSPPCPPMSLVQLPMSLLTCSLPFPYPIAFCIIFYVPGESQWILRSSFPQLQGISLTYMTQVQSWPSWSSQLTPPLLSASSVDTLTVINRHPAQPSLTPICHRPFHSRPIKLTGLNFSQLRSVLL